MIWLDKSRVKSSDRVCINPSEDTMSKPEEFDSGTVNDGGSQTKATAGTATEARPEARSEAGAETDSTFEESLHSFVERNAFFDLFKTYQGMMVMFGGVILPGLLSLSYFYACHERMTLLILKHPIESIVELLLCLAVPIGNYLVWASLVNCDYRAQIKKGILNGIALGSAALISLLAVVAVCLGYPTSSLDGTDHSGAAIIIGAIYLVSALVSAHLLNEVRKTRISESGRLKALWVAGMGVLLSIVGFAGSEARETAIKMAEHMAISEDQAQQAEGMKTLRWLYPRKELNMECANYKAVSLPGMFVKLDNVTLRQLYFQVTGEPFRDDKSANFSSMPDDYLQRHVVGKAVDGLSLHRSKMFGHINPETLSSTIFWNFVFKNKSYNPEEARVELGLPEGAVISGMTIWKDGSAQGTMFKPTMANPGTISWSAQGHQAPGVVTDLGRGRVLLHCYPVPAQDQLRVAVAITIPAKLHTIDQASLPLPKIIDANFSMKGEHSLRMISPASISLKVDGLKVSQQKDGNYVIGGKLKSDTITGAGVSLDLKRGATYGPISVFDNLGKEPRYISQTIKKIPARAPKRLLVVLDGSESVKPHLDNLKEVLSRISSEIDASLILASRLQDENNPKTMERPLREAIKNLNDKDFVGGQDNLESVVKAAELAAESKEGAVLWIHGPQPSFNKEIYILSPFQEKPSFFELALDNGVMDPNEFFKHHKDLGPFTPIARSSHPAADLSRFLSKWTPGGYEYLVEYQTSKTPIGKVAVKPEQIRELGALFAREHCAQLLNKNLVRPAVEEAVLHRIVTPVSLASTVLDNSSRSASTLAEGMHNHSVQIVGGEEDEVLRMLRPQSEQIAMAPSENLHYSARAAESLAGNSVTIDDTDNTAILQGATNGTIGPQGGDATAIMGVNTAGTVRVNNLANLEAMLNILVNGIEILGLATGGLMLASVFFPSKNETNAFFKASVGNKIMVGLCLILGALSAPGVVNYFVASARDANLFS